MNVRVDANKLAASCWLLVAGAVAFSCGVDGRGLSYQASAVGSASAHGGDGGAVAEAGRGGHPASGTSAGENGVAGSGNEGGRDASGGGADTGGAGADGAGQGGAPAMGGAGVTGGVGGGGSGTAGTAGSAGMGGEPGNFPCGNLNHNDKDDCEETLVKNSRFDSTASEWIAEGALVQAWHGENARGGSGSGSLLLTNSNVVAGSVGSTALASNQCLEAWGKEALEVGARVFITPGQASGNASVSVLYFGNDGCQGTVLGGSEVARTWDAGSWQAVRGSVRLPPATRSVWIRLMLIKPFTQPSLEAKFDDVLVVKKQ